MKYIMIIGLALVGLLLFSCDKDTERTSLIGSWNCEEFPEQTLPRIYQVSIMRNPYTPNKTNEYLISNFYNWGLSQSAEVYFYQDTLTGELIIPDQTVAINNNTVFGKGVVADDFSKIDWEYNVSSGVVNEKAMANYY